MKLRRRVENTKKLHQRMNQKVLAPIDERSDIGNERTTIGDWEGDLTKGKRTVNEPTVLTLTDRLSRFKIIVKVPNYYADTCRNALQSIIDKYGADKFHSVTFDNGSEFSLLSQVKGEKASKPVVKVTDNTTHKKVKVTHVTNYNSETGYGWFKTSISYQPTLSKVKVNHAYTVKISGLGNHADVNYQTKLFKLSKELGSV